MTFEIESLEPFGVLVTPGRSGQEVHRLDLDVLRGLVETHHLLVLRGFDAFPHVDAFVAYGERWGDISMWPFGKVLELVEHPAPEDHIFDHRDVPLHWDGMYRPQVPELQMFWCVRAPEADQGGRTTFSNTRLALERLAPDLRSAWEGIEGVYERRMAFYDSQTIAPLITRHPTRGYPVIRYAEPPQEGDTGFINHPAIALRGLDDDSAAEVHRVLQGVLHDPACLHAHAWRTGDVVVADNHTLLHGREAFVSGAPRHLRRLHILGTPPLENPHLVSHA